MRVEVTRHEQFSMTPMRDCEPLPALAEASRQLDGFTHFVDAGTLLGIWRDGRLIPHDTDLDFAIVVDWVKPGKVPALKGIKEVRTITAKGRPMQRAYLHGDVIVDLYYYWTGIEPCVAVNKSDMGTMRMPLELVDFRKAHEFEGVTVQIPQDPDAYLEWRYGSSWRIPARSKQSWSHDAACLEAS